MSPPWPLTRSRTKLSTPDNPWFAWEKADDWVNGGPEVLLANGKVFVTIYGPGHNSFFKSLTGRKSGWPTTRART
ncbi:hypothetical protein SAMN05444354_107197 [Stigmatella aurantiaca]|uniref:Uncharacterized protein n=1 Tax=Stigmatella aurantiaca TaxID=41 RepID=A0A1H7RUW3_STIAU|nr:hypothetical protein [Stigmatella aurantiaca]SEL64043.1 hypothetical protein SAMN05444354_107197 [Stigmatella aurantiaca]